MIKRFSLMLLCFLLVTLNVCGFTITHDGITEEYTGRVVTLYVNGAKVETDVPAVIMNSRTLVPARAVFERLGAVVSWDEALRKTTISLKNTDVQLTVDSDVALVNGESKMLDSPAKIINDRIMIPVRFPAEAIGCTVEWNDADGSVRIDLDSGCVDVTGVESVYADGFVTTTVNFSGEIGDVSHFVLGSDRIVVDIPRGKLTSAYPDKTFGNLTIKSIRFGQFKIDPYVMRIVADVSEIKEYYVKREGNSVIFQVRADEVNAYVPPVADVSWTNGLVLSPAVANKLVFIDPGHGGTDVGAIGRENGVDVLYEKEVNLAVSLYLNQYLTSAGVKTYMLRSDNSTVSLYDRPEIANNLGADLYVSVHSNSFGTDKPKGTTVLYFANDGGSPAGKVLAQNIQTEIVNTLGTYDRGLTNGSEMYVIRKSTMPSVIVEMAFISNPEDRKILADDNCRRLLAQAIARGIIKTLNGIS